MKAVRCTECAHVFSATAVAAEDPDLWGHPCFAEGSRIKKGVTPCESYREPVIEQEKKKPRVLNKRDLPGATHPIPDGAVYVGRPSKWGNPFKLVEDTDRDQVLSRYRDWLVSHPEIVDAAKRELKGKDLVCWCAPLPCHADVLLGIANDGS